MTGTRVVELSPELAAKLTQTLGSAEFHAFELLGVQSLNNRVLQLVRMDNGQRYAVRLANERAKRHMGASAQEEAVIACVTGKAGIGPRMLHYDFETAMMVTKWIDQAAPLSQEALQHPDAMQQVIALVRQLHAIDADAALPGGRTIFERIAHMERSVAPLMAGELIEPRHRQGLQELAALPPKRWCLTHKDLWPNNILADGARFWLTDWEFSSIGDGIYDLATLSLSVGLDQPFEARLLADYGDGAGDLDWLAAMKWVVSYFEAVWSANMALLSASAPEASGKPFDFKGHSERMIARLGDDEYGAA